MKCPACGTISAPESRFCGKCGTRLTPLAATPPATSVGGTTPPVAERRLSKATPRSVTPTAERSAASNAPRPALNHMNLVGETLDGRYRIIRKLGEGGMSFVYLAGDVGSGVQYAVKILSPALSKDGNAMARLRREAALGMRLEHPNVCHIVRLGETEDGLVYVVMPYVNGDILSDRTHRVGHIPAETAARWVMDIANGLEVAHALRIVHRDLKPENIMICRRPDGSEYAVVMDFGLAKERKSETEIERLTATGIILGTPEFMSPEQLRGKPLDARSDVYSLALMAYELLTGKLPFEGRTQQEMMIARLRSDPMPLRARRPELGFSEALEQVLLKGMARDIEQRYQSAATFAREFAVAAGITPGHLFA